MRRWIVVGIQAVKASSNPNYLQQGALQASIVGFEAFFSHSQQEGIGEVGAFFNCGHSYFYRLVRD